MPADNTPHTATATAEAIRRAYLRKSEADPRGSFVSRKNGRGIPVWSYADYRFCEMAERCPRIVSYEAQPDILILDDRGHPVPFVIDFLVDLDTRLVLVALPLGSTFPEAVESRYVGLARTQCMMAGKDFVHLPGSTFMPETHPVRDEPDAPPPLVLRGPSYRRQHPAQRGAVERAFQAGSDRLLARFCRRLVARATFPAWAARHERAPREHPHRPHAPGIRPGRVPPRALHSFGRTGTEC